MSRNLPAKIHVPEIDADFLLIPAGAFYAGGLKDRKDAPRRLAVITKPFYMQETPVTQRQYQSLTGTNPSKFENNPDHPVERVSWKDSVDFADRLRRQTGLNFRLPTEMEWEYAARGGEGDKYTYAGSNTIKEVAWHRGNSNYETQPVKQKKPNGYGLYDMTGNVYEWCSDNYAPYPNQELIDYRGSASGPNRVSRGGSWSNMRDLARVALRLGPGPDFCDRDLGFRLVLEAP